MLVQELGKNPGKNKKGLRVGRGNSSGRGNYSRRGMKGQDSRSGGGVPDTFEGGQTPLNRRLPKLRGFKRFFKLGSTVQPVNLERLNADDRVPAGTDITKDMLYELGYVRSAVKNVKLLGKECSKKLNFVDIDTASAAAQSAVEAAGGKIAFAAAGAAMQEQE